MQNILIFVLALFGPIILYISFFGSIWIINRFILAYKVKRFQKRIETQKRTTIPDIEVTDMIHVSDKGIERR